MITDDKLMTETEASVYLGKSKQYLYMRRKAGKSVPVHEAVGKSVVYRQSEVDAWEPPKRAFVRSETSMKALCEKHGWKMRGGVYLSEEEYAGLKQYAEQEPKSTIPMAIRELLIQALAEYGFDGEPEEEEDSGVL